MVFFFWSSSSHIVSSIDSGLSGWTRRVRLGALHLEVVLHF
jgi:hypothetical protein